MEELALPRAIAGLITDFSTELKTCLGTGLESVILYGSAARDEFSLSGSDINLLVVVRDDSLGQIEKAAALVQKGKYRRIEPFFITRRKIEQSLDVFPIEFLDIMERYRVVAGTDSLDRLMIKTTHLRFQCEHELKAKLFLVKAVFLKQCRSPRILRAILTRAGASTLHLMRNLLRIKGIAPAASSTAVLSQLEEHFTLKKELFERIRTIKEKQVRLSPAELKALYADFCAELERIVQLVNGL